MPLQGPPGVEGTEESKHHLLGSLSLRVVSHECEEVHVLLAKEKLPRLQVRSIPQQSLLVVVLQRARAQVLQHSEAKLSHTILEPLENTFDIFVRIGV